MNPFCRSNVLGLVAAILSACTVSVSDVDPEGAGGKSDDDGTEGKLSHEAALAKCWADREANEGNPEIGIVTVYGEWAACLEKANDQAVAAIEQRLDDAKSLQAGAVGQLFASFRRASNNLCLLLEPISATDSPVALIDCQGQQEAVLGELIDAYVSFPSTGLRPILPKPNLYFTECYEAWSAAESAAPDDLRIAASTLLACMGDKFQSSANKIADTFADKGQTWALSFARSVKVLAAITAASTSLCVALADAGPSGEAYPSLKQFATCTASAIRGINDQNIMDFLYGGTDH